MVTARTTNTLRNILFSYADVLVTIVFQFVSRTVIIHILGSEYLGLSSLFSAILQVLNMAEMGFSVAIIYNMYKPIAENDEKKICSLLNYYKKIYGYVSKAIVTIGLMVLPILPLLIGNSYPSDIDIYIIYILYLINTVCSYVFFAYKTALLTALQRLDLVKISYTIANLLQYFLQLTSIIVFENYYYFVISLIIGTILKNCISAYNSKKYYSRFVCHGEIDSETKLDIKKRVKGLLICNISAITFTSLDSIIISALLGLTAVAIYNNYIAIYTGVMSFVVLIRHSMQASVGNSVAIESKKKNLCDLELFQFMFSVIATLCSVCMLCLYQPFMAIWMGEDMLLPLSNVILLCIWAYISIVQHPYFLYMSGNGMWMEMKWPYIISTVCNLSLNFGLGYILGTTGIILATVIASFLFGMIWQCVIVFKKYFGISARSYLKRQALYFVFFSFVSFTSYLFCEIVQFVGIIELMIKLIICIFITMMAIILIYGKSDLFAKSQMIIKRALN